MQRTILRPWRLFLAVMVIAVISFWVFSGRSANAASGKIDFGVQLNEGESTTGLRAYDLVGPIDPDGKSRALQLGDVHAVASGGGSLTISVVDKDDGKPMADGSTRQEDSSNLYMDFTNAVKNNAFEDPATGEVLFTNSIKPLKDDETASITQLFAPFKGYDHITSITFLRSNYSSVGTGVDTTISPAQVYNILKGVVIKQKSPITGGFSHGNDVKAADAARVYVDYNSVPAIEQEFDGVKHYYQVVDANDYITWTDARKAAKDREPFHGLKGYLATITSEDEQNFIFKNIGKRVGWLGGTRIVDDNDQMYKDTDFIDDSSNGSAEDAGRHKGNKWYWADGPESLPNDPNYNKKVFYNYFNYRFYDSVNHVFFPPHHRGTQDNPNFEFFSNDDHGIRGGVEPNSSGKDHYDDEGGEYFLLFGWEKNGQWNDFGNNQENKDFDWINGGYIGRLDREMRAYYVEYSPYNGQVEDPYIGTSFADIPAPLEIKMVDELGNLLSETTPEFNWGPDGPDNHGNIGASNIFDRNLAEKNAPEIPGYTFVRIVNHSKYPEYFDETFPIKYEAPDSLTTEDKRQGPTEKGTFDRYVQYVEMVYRPVDNMNTRPGTDKNINTSETPGVPETPETPTTPTLPDKPVSPEKVIKKGEAVYNIDKIGLYKTTNFNKANRIKSYMKRTRIDRYQFIVKGYGRGSNGALCYYVQQYNPYKNRYIAGTKGYITAGRKLVQPVYYKATGTKRVKVINPRGVKAYTNKQLTNYKKLYKKGAVLRVTKVVKQKYTTRFQLDNGLYITANKKFVIMK